MRKTIGIAAHMNKALPRIRIAVAIPLLIACATMASCTIPPTPDPDTLPSSVLEAPSADYLEAVGKIHAYGREMAAFFEGYDILLSPTLAEPPAEVGRFAHATGDFAGFRMGPGMVFAYSPFCAPFNASGQPAASAPLYWTLEGLPIGVQLAAPFGADEALIALCREIEEARPWFGRRPKMEV